jgi:hypothetical protein
MRLILFDPRCFLRNLKVKITQIWCARCKLRLDGIGDLQCSRREFGKNNIIWIDQAFQKICAEFLIERKIRDSFADYFL